MFVLLSLFIYGGIYLSPENDHTSNNRPRFLVQNIQLWDNLLRKKNNNNNKVEISNKREQQETISLLFIKYETKQEKKTKRKWVGLNKNQQNKNNK